MAEGRFVSYLRVPKAKQGHSGLGLEAQRKAVADYLNGGQWQLVTEIVEIVSDKQSNWPRLVEALRLCRLHNATLVIANLNRLRRDAHFLLCLEKADVDFVATDMPSATRLTVRTMAMAAYEERRMISKRTREGLAVAKAKGKDDAPDVDLLAYTFSFGNGFSASISIEDGLDRRRGILNPGFVDPATGLLVAGGDIPYAGQRLPDLVANVKYTAAWGTAQISGAVHQIRSVVLGTGPAGATGGTGNLPAAFLPGLVGTIPDNEYGFAIAGYLGVNLPMLGAGDALWLAATYADGAPAYLDGGNSGTIITPFAAFQGFTGGLADATIDPFTGDLDKTRAWSIAGGLRHYWTPEIRSNLFGSYLDSDSRSPFTTFSDFREIRVGANVFWQPVSGLDIGVEVIYANVDQRGTNGFVFGDDDDNGWEGRLRIQRDF